MALKKDSDRVMMTLSVKKETRDKLAELAAKNDRPVGRMLDFIIKNFEVKNG